LPRDLKLLEPCPRILRLGPHRAGLIHCWCKNLEFRTEARAKRSPVRVFFDRAGQSRPPVHVCFALKSDLGPTYRREAIATSRFTLAERANWLNGSSIRSNNADGSRRATTSSRPTILPSSSLSQYGCGCALMSPRPSDGAATRRRRSTSKVRLSPGEAALPGRICPDRLHSPTRSTGTHRHLRRRGSRTGL
jgi:hypothetical protein